ncbi:MAG: hypothetical protein K2R98_01915 [Gemmataceae bacterium]|nr:hypothetical protein [Gemmataceae bacterium]
MMKKIAAVVIVLFGVGMLVAAEAKGKVKKVEKGAITVEVDGKDVEYKLGKETKVYEGSDEVTGKDKGKLLKGLKEGTEVTIIYDKDGDKITVKEFKIKK